MKFLFIPRLDERERYVKPTKCRRKIIVHFSEKERFEESLVFKSYPMENDELQRYARILNEKSSERNNAQMAKQLTMKVGE